MISGVGMAGINYKTAFPVRRMMLGFRLINNVEKMFFSN